MSVNTAQIIARSLEALGVEYTFGMPGAFNLELFNSLSSTNIKNILITNELCAAFAADGYARATGRTGVCVVIPGPGLTNMITGLAEAYCDSSSLVVIVPGFRESDKSFHIHEINQIDMIRPVVKGVFEVSKAVEVQDALYKAFKLSSEGEPGPVVCQIDKELFSENGVFKNDFSGFQKTRELSSDDKARISEIAGIISGSKACGIYAGFGAMGASKNVIELAELLGAPVATTISGKGVIPEDHRLSVGFGFGPTGSGLAEDAFSRCDTVIALGCKFSEMATGAWSMNIPGTLIHVDINQSSLDKNYKSGISLCADIDAVLCELLPLLKKSVNVKEAVSFSDKKKARCSDRNGSAGKGVLPSDVLFYLRRLMKRNSVLVTDVGNHQLWAISDFDVFEPRTFITPSDYQAMGFGVPAAIGAKLGCQEKEVVCVCGDGGFLISGVEVLTAARLGLDIKIIVFNDGALGLIKELQGKIYGRYSCVDFTAPDYRKLAEAYRLDYVEIKSESVLEDGLKQALSKKGAVLVNVEVSYDEISDYIKGASIAAWNRLSLVEKITLVGKKIGQSFKKV